MTEANRKTLLIVDDTPENIEVLNGLLSEKYRVRLALNGPKAISIATSDNPPDLILLDIMMPGMDGYEVIRHLKDSDVSRGLPVIFLTSLSDAADEIRGFSLGAEDYITKPFNPVIVKARVATHLALAEARMALVRQNEELRAAKEKAEDATKLKDRFVSLVAHDLRSPFAAIIGLVDLVCSDEKEPVAPRHKQLLDRVLQSGRSQMRMIDELLKISMLQTGKITVEKRFLDVGALVTSLAGRVQGVAEPKGVEIVNAVPPGARFHVDYDLFTQVLQNLIVNAIKFSKMGDKVTVFVPEGRMDTIAVRDTGVGVKKEFLPKLFNHEERTTTRGTSGETGTGLGLPFANDIVKAHGGTLTVESEVGKGSVFYVQVPQIRPLVMIMGETPDEELAALEKNLEKNGINLVVEREMDKAYSTIIGNPPHLIILYLDAAREEGFSLLANLKKNAGMKDIPVMAIASVTGVNVREKALSYGVNDFIHAPFDPQNFISLIKKNLA